MNALKNSRTGRSIKERELGLAEMRSLHGGLAVHTSTVTWKYVSATPQWAIDNARSVGYEVERIS